MSEMMISLLINGESLDPKDVTDAIQAPPTDQFKKGDPVGRIGGSHGLRHRHGQWCLTKTACNSAEFNAALREFLNLVPENLTDMLASSSVSIDVFVGVFGVRDQTGIELPADLLLELGRRGWSIIFDLYTSGAEDD
ncbi:MAG: DUF4279 domain-containing protein [Phycisphaerae bacterium]